MSVDIEVRPLITEDIFTVARMLSKVTKSARVELATAITSKKKTDPTELGMTLFQSVFIETEEDLKAWLADLIGKTKEEFKVMSAKTVINIFQVLVKQEDVVDFFGQVSQFVTKMGDQT